MSTTLATAVRHQPPPVIAEPVIECEDVTKRYGRTVIHEHLNLQVRRGEIVALLGGSGSGKTTLVRQMLGLESPTSGTIRVLGEEWANMDEETARMLRTRSGMMFQQGALFSSLSVYDNIAQPFRELGKIPEDLIREFVMLKLEMVGLSCKHASKMPAALSGGMIKRVGIARAIALEPELLFLDEPTAGLDPKASDEFVDLIATLHRALGLTVVMVTHDLDTMVALSTRVAVLADRRVLVAAPVEEAVAVDHPFIREYFLGRRGRRALQALPFERRAKLPAVALEEAPLQLANMEATRKRKRNLSMENKSHAFWAGLFTIGLVAAIAITVFFFNVDRTVRVPYDLIARTNVTGLFTDAAVRYRGLGVGKVESIRFDRSHPGQIRIRILVDKNAPMTHSTYATLGFQGVTGIAFVQLDDTGKDTRDLPSSAKDVAEVPMRPGIFDQLQQRGDVILRKFERLADDADKFLSDDVRDELMRTSKSLRGAADGIATLASQVGPATARLPADADATGQGARVHQRADSEPEPAGRAVRVESEQGGRGGAAGGRRARRHERLAAGALGARRLRDAAARQFARRRRQQRRALGRPRRRHVQHEPAQRAVRRAGAGAGTRRAGLQLAGESWQ